MINITQNKVAGFTPRWAPFPGFSILFDNPGESVLPSIDFLTILCSSAPGGDLALYYWLDKTLEELGREFLIREFLFCPLPPSTYHVTVWDGINADNITSVNADLRSDWTTFLAGIPISLSMPPASMSLITHSALITSHIEPIRFRFGTLAIWGNQVLVACLVPADELACAALDNLCVARNHLCDLFKQNLSVSPNKKYSPHVSLGYFANQDCGENAHSRLQDWSKIFSDNLASSVIKYKTLSIYAFTDMVSFYKRT